LRTTTYRVAGMTCDHCVRAVRGELSALEGVAEVDIDLSSGLVTLHGDQFPPEAAVRAAVEEAGYELAGDAAS